MLPARAHTSAMMTLALESLALEAPDVSFVHTFPGLVRTQLGKDTKSAGITVLRAVFKVVGPLVTIPIPEAGERQLFMATSARFPARGGRDIEETSGVSLGFGSFADNTTTLDAGNSNTNKRPSIEIRPTASGSVLSAVPSSTSSSPSTIRDSSGSSSARNSHSSHSTNSSAMTTMSLKVARGTDGREGSGVYSVSYDGEGLSNKTEEVLRVMREEQDMVRKVWLHVEDEFERVTGSKFVV